MKYSVEIVERDNATSGYTKRYIGKKAKEFFTATGRDLNFEDSGIEIERQDLTEEFGFEDEESAEKVAGMMNVRGLNNDVISISVV